MNRKKLFSIIAVLFILTALTMYTVLEKENAAHDYFWSPLLLSALFLVVSTRVK